MSVQGRELVEKHIQPTNREFNNAKRAITYLHLPTCAMARSAVTVLRCRKSTCAGCRMTRSEVELDSHVACSTETRALIVPPLTTAATILTRLMKGVPPHTVRSATTVLLCRVEGRRTHPFATRLVTANTALCTCDICSTVAFPCSVCVQRGTV